MKRAVALWVTFLMLVVCLFPCVIQAAEEETLGEGKYIIGKDIEPGSYTLTCTGTSGQKMNGAYKALGHAFDVLDEDEGESFGSLFGALGGIAEECVDMTAEILGDYGDVLKTYSMNVGESISIELKEETALQISDGSCTIILEQ